MLMAGILSLIQFQYGRDLRRYSIGPFDLDDLVQIMLEYCCHALLTLCYGSGYWLSIYSIYCLKFRLHGQLIPCLLASILCQVNVPVELTLYQRFRLFVGLDVPTDLAKDMWQIVTGIIFALVTITDLVFMKAANNDENVGVEQNVDNARDEDDDQAQAG